MAKATGIASKDAPNFVKITAIGRAEARMNVITGIDAVLAFATSRVLANACSTWIMLTIDDAKITATNP